MSTRAASMRFGNLLPVGLLIAAFGCSQPQAEPAEFIQPEAGTVYRYRDMVNVILETDGIRTRYRDQQGRIADRLGLFLTTIPGTAVQVDTAALMSLWPLQAGKTAVVEIKNGDEVYQYEFVVQRVETVETGFGTFDAFVVQGVVSPEMVRNPAAAQTMMNSWWYVPELNAVARFQTTYLAGPGQGKVVGDRLVEIMDEASYEAWRKEQGDTATTAPQETAPPRDTVGA